MDLKQFDDLLHDAEVKLKRLKALYEQWFQGIERTEPLIARKDLDRTLQILSRDKPRNTAARFRLAQLNARYSVYATYWGRIGRQIEEGSFVRVPYAKRAQAKASMRPAKPYEIEEEIDLSGEDLEGDAIASVIDALEAPPVPPAAATKAAFSAFSPFALGPRKRPPLETPAETRAPATKPSQRPAGAPARPIEPRAPSKPIAPGPLELSLDLDVPEAPSPKPPPPRPPPPPPPRAAVAPGPPVPKPVTATFGKPRPAAAPPPKDEMKSLYDEFVAARRKNNEPVDNVVFEKVKGSLEKMRERLREKHGDKKIGFEVVVQDGKVGLKPKID